MPSIPITGSISSSLTPSVSFCDALCERFFLFRGHVLGVDTIE